MSATRLRVRIRAPGPALLVILALALAVAMAPARAARGAPDTVVTDHVRATLVTEASAVAPGAVFALGLRLEMKPGWHTYWRNPGDSGEATRITWTFPPEITLAGTGSRSGPAGSEDNGAGAILWPAPQRLPLGPLVNYGYEGSVLLAVPVRVAPTAPASGTLVIRARASWLVCADICIPEEGVFEISLPLGPRLEPSAAAPAFLAAQRRVPAPLPGTARFAPAGDDIVLDIAWSDAAMKSPGKRPWFFPFAYGEIAFAGAQTTRHRDGGMTLFLPRARAAGAGSPAGLPSDAAPLTGVLVLGDPARSGAAFELAAALDPALAFDPALASGRGAPSFPIGIGVWQALLFALLGGVLLNLMPCVFPVLFMKAGALMRDAHAGLAPRRAGALAYASGIVLGFLALAAALLLLRAGGEALGWGFQLQSPTVIVALALLFFALGLSLSGVFDLGERIMGYGDGLARRDGHVGSFFTGVLAVVVASPCTAPFMGAALGFAITQSAVLALAVFAALGVGLALPFLAISFSPVLLSRLPKPGPWMGTAKQALAFPLYATAAWLLWVLARQAGNDALALALAAAIAVAALCWLAGRAARGRWVYGALAFAVAGAAAAATGRLDGPAAAPEASLSSAAWSAEKVRSLTDDGKTVFVNFTADWCITCKVNERVALDRPGPRAAFASGKSVYLVADWTRRDPDITRALADFGRNGVPLYVVYRRGAPPRILPALLTERLVTDALAGVE